MAILCKSLLRRGLATPEGGICPAQGPLVYIPRGIGHTVWQGRQGRAAGRIPSCFLYYKTPVGRRFFMISPEVKRRLKEAGIPLSDAKRYIDIVKNYLQVAQVNENGLITIQKKIKEELV